MDTTEDYPGFGTLGPPQAAFVYQRIIYPAICAAFGEPDPSEIPAYAFYPGPFVVPAAYRQQQQVPSASVVNFTTNFFASARAAAATKTAASTYRARY